MSFNIFKVKATPEADGVFEHPEYSADASSCVGTMIGGRLDYVKFADAAAGLLPELLRQPVP